MFLKLVLLAQEIMFDLIGVVAGVVQLLDLFIFMVHVGRVLAKLRLESFRAL